LGTRADFYIGRGKTAEWLGSIGWDGYPDGVPKILLTAKTERQFRRRVKKIACENDDFTQPERGWPWPWDDSNITDYAYAFDEGQVWYTGMKGWHPAQSGPDTAEYEGSYTLEFPNMAARRNLRLDSGSGLIIIG
jgi:hypothetical protein